VGFPAPNTSPLARSGKSPFTAATSSALLEFGRDLTEARAAVAKAREFARARMAEMVAAIG
jgi:hypothetical protein